MSANERDWFSPKNERRREDDPSPSPPPPPPSQEPPAGLGPRASSPPGPGRGSGAPLPEPPSWEATPPGAETAPVPRVPSVDETAPVPRVPPAGEPPMGEPPGQGTPPPRHGGRRGRATPPPGYDALDDQPGDWGQDPLGWPSTPPSGPQPAHGRPSHGQEPPPGPQPAPDRSAAYGQGPARGPQPPHDQPPYGRGPAHGRPSYEQDPAHDRPAYGRGPAHGQHAAQEQYPGYGQEPPHGQQPAHGPRVPPRHGAPQGRARHGQPDQQVWPPAQREPIGGVTQPLPAVQGPFEPRQSAPPAGAPPHAPATPFPPRPGAVPPPGPPLHPEDPFGSRQQAEGPYATHPSEGSYATHPGEGSYATHPGEGPHATNPGEGPYATHPGEGPYGARNPEAAQLPDGAQQSEGAHGPESAQRAPSAGAPKARRKRTVLIAAGAVVVSLLTMGAQSYDGYLFYEKSTTKETKEIIVAAGQAGRVNNIEYRATISPAKPPEDSKHGPEVTWLQVDITKKVLDEANATMTAKPTEIQLDDRTGRVWTVVTQEVGEQPTDRLVVGKAYRIQGLALVPTPVANEVELSFRPSTYRSDTPIDDLFSREAVEKMEKDVEVLRFRRR